MGWLSSAVSAVSSTFSSACSAVGNAISNTFGNVTDTFSKTINDLGTVLTTTSAILTALSVVIPHPQLRLAVKVIDSALVVLGLLKENETTEDIGDMALQAYEADIKPADFSSYDEYISALRNFKLDPEKSEKFNFGEKVSAGITIQAWGLEEKIGQGSSDLLVYILKDAPNVIKGEGYFTETRVQNIIGKIKDISDVAKYFSNKLNPDKNNDIEQELVKAEQNLNPDKSVDEIYQELDKHKSE
ncbi:hypothetical protein PYR74_07195 [Acinetobacter bereziniae]|uniref:hypothetical protein n=4 Tax=Acinetobacter bereziniae TaxID=106648 RepID=UPI0015812C4F|nr:hypothetical protein [Acinetobacter bereziniae]NUF64282.1 hypothetical protein [Acinetobacter bereziniae]NUG63994.1 hypothetical protein [Acinetobacter bereziniae]WEI23745.1 hypothetical protein PYR74_07195 [Acinetobacter bereziniae]